MQGQPEIENARLTVLVQTDIPRLQVPMNEAAPVGEVDRTRDIAQQFQDPIGPGSMGIASLVQRGAVDVFHDDQRHPSLFDDVEDADDAGMLQGRDGPRFGDRAVDVGLRFENVRPGFLDRHVPLKLLVPRQVDSAKGALPQKLS